MSTIDSLADDIMAGLQEYVSLALFGDDCTQ